MTSSRQYCSTVNKWQRRTHGTRVVNCGASFLLAVAKFGWRGEGGNGEGVGSLTRVPDVPKRGPPNKLPYRSRDGRLSLQGGGGLVEGWLCLSRLLVCLYRSCTD